MGAAVGRGEPAPRGLTGQPPRFRPSTDAEVAPSGPAAKAAANLEALRVLRRLQTDGRPASADEQATLARWSSWGSLPGVFDPADRRWDTLRAELRVALDDREWRAAERTTLNAHYTPVAFAQHLWSAVGRLGLSGGRVLEAGCGAGTFLGTVPGSGDWELVGVELDPVTAGIAAALHPHAAIRNESFAETRYPDGWFDAAVGNVPFVF